jgi:very-short-patch-repair endonuclease
MDTLTDERLMASAVRFLLEGDEREAAQILLSCTLTDVSEPYVDDPGWDTRRMTVDVHLVGSRQAYEAINEANSELGAAIRRAFEAVLRDDLGDLAISAELIEPEPEWRQQSELLASEESTSNQAPFSRRPILWKNLRFESVSEVKIAEALERAKVLFFPNSVARLGNQDRLNRMPDFLICRGGKWGILEVDGEPFHPATRAAEDHRRDRLFKAHGVAVVEHFDAGECFSEPDAVVERFLTILEQST